ncbi:conserved hypothetical protein [Nesidiocoris tenuis]|uniref:FP protein C-terminal domain-containing protein n=1 Tax=Nesidiocoris tenuis TaxID=355587 RepID=A0ABN7BFE0_9HEMI|nr:conserved hypothetical protein [Nesidiocoris tenuis]
MRCRSEIVGIARAKKRLTAKDLHPGWPQHRVYVNENLTNFRSELLRRTKLAAKEKGFKFVWVKNFVVHTRKTEGDQVKTIKSFDDIDRM